MRRPEAPLVSADYQVELTRRSVAGLTAAAAAITFLVFLSGLVVGVNLTLESGPGAPVGDEVSADGATPSAAAQVEMPAARGATTAAVPLEQPPTPADAAAVMQTLFLQAGAFRSEENAESLRARLADRGYPARTRPTPGSAGQPLFRVLVGEYRSEAEAERAADRFRTDTGQEVYVMTEAELAS